MVYHIYDIFRYWGKNGMESFAYFHFVQYSRHPQADHSVRHPLRRIVWATLQLFRSCSAHIVLQAHSGAIPALHGPRKGALLRAQEKGPGFSPQAADSVAGSREEDPRIAGIAGSMGVWQ